MLPSSNEAALNDELDKLRRTVDAEPFDIIIRQLMDMVVDGSINIAPDYQRRFTWDEVRQSELIESIYLSIPVPPLFFAENKNGTLEVIDGVQRISTIARFIGSTDLLKKIDQEKPLQLTGLSKLTTFNGRTYNKLPVGLRNRFNLRSLRIISLNDKSDLDVRYDLFQRLNTGGIVLHPQEIRNCIYRGEFNDLLHKLKSFDAFQASIHLTKGVSEAVFEEYVLRYFAYLESYKDFDGAVGKFLSEYMSKRVDNPPNKDLVKTFRETFRFIIKELPGGIRSKRNVTPVNLFEAISVGTGLILQDNKTPKLGKLPKLIDDPGLRKFTTAGTNARNMVRGRIEYVRDHLMP